MKTATVGIHALDEDCITDQNGENGGRPVRGFCAQGLQLVHCVSEIWRFAMTASGSQTPSSTVGFSDW